MCASVLLPLATSSSASLKNALLGPHNYRITLFANPGHPLDTHEPTSNATRDADAPNIGHSKAAAFCVAHYVRGSPDAL